MANINELNQFNLLTLTGEQYKQFETTNKQFSNGKLLDHCSNIHKSISDSFCIEHIELTVVCMCLAIKSHEFRMQIRNNIDQTQTSVWASALIVLIQTQTDTLTISLQLGCTAR